MNAVYTSRLDGMNLQFNWGTAEIFSLIKNYRLSAAQGSDRTWIYYTEIVLTWISYKFKL
jgi:hypothetical protein